MKTKNKLRSIIIGYCATSISIFYLLLMPQFTDLASWSYQLDSNPVSIGISANGNYIAVGGLNGKVSLLDSTSLTALWEYETGDSVDSIAISSDGTFIVAGSKDEKIYFFNKSQSTPLWNVTTEGTIKSVDLSSNGGIAIATDNKRVYVMNTTIPSVSSIKPTVFLATLDFITNVDLTSDGQFYTFCADFGTTDKIYRYRWPTTMLQEIDSPHIGSEFGSAAISDDGKYFICTTLDTYDPDYVRVFINSSGTEVWSHSTSKIITCIDISYDGEKIVYGTYDDSSSWPTHNIHVLSNSGEHQINSYSVGAAVDYIKLSKVDHYLAASADVLYFYGENQEWKENYPGVIAISDDGNSIAVGCSMNSKVYVFNRENPIVIEDLQFFSSIGLIPSLVSIGLIIAYNFLYIRNIRREKARKEQLKDLMKVSNKISLDMVCSILDVDKETVNKYLLSTTLGSNFKIEGNNLIIQADDLSGFLDSLDAEFKKWEKMEKDRTDKI